MTTSKLKKLSSGTFFLTAVVTAYLIVALLNQQLLFKSLRGAWSIFIKLMPIMILVFILLFITSYFVSAKRVKSWIEGKSGFRKWSIALGSGILSTGPIYMWYPLLKDLTKKGITSGFVATFLYGRAIKPALFPLMISYFGLYYTIMFNIIIAVLAIVQGLVIDKTTGGKLI